MWKDLRLLAIALVIATSVMTPGAALAGGPDYQSAKGGFSIILDEACPASDVPPVNIAFFTPELDFEGVSRSVQCVATARDGGQVVRNGVRVELEGEIVDLDGNTIQTLSPRNRNLNPYGRFSWPFPASPGGSVITIEGEVAGNRMIDQVQIDCRGQGRVPCVSDLDTGCVFGNGRFKVEVDFDSGSGFEPAGVRRIKGLTTEFFFFNSETTDLIVEMQNRCLASDHFWVFYGSLTNVGFELTVTDTQSGATKSYTNPLGMAAPAVLDTAAFATCP